MHKKILFLTLIILVLIPALTSATILTIKGKSGYNLTINVLNPLNNESAIPSVITADIGSSGQVNVEFSVSNAKASIITIARVNGKIAKKKELYNVNTQTTVPIIVDLTDPPPAPEPVPAPIPAPAVQNITPPPASESAPIQAPVQETAENKTSFLTAMAISFDSINLSPTIKKIILYTIIGLAVIVLVVIIIIFLIKRKRKFKSNEDLKGFKVTKLSSLTKESEPEDIEEAEKRLKIAKDEINRINEILNKRRAIKEAEKKLEEERQALEKLKKGYR
ncbi:hypothetical protein J4429_04310 [Candidatus Pacearchaeota archaeon]|nr:hypothetical protein [Candidatus Pacearchaeota archaeon]